ncbi:group 1 glycosyl transferase [Calothrix sp. NIES-4071]|nr:group 1 glycosyl transferase [Calothrix sp. NIES-4071]BAZ58362.1 group 1 glycosyl transferase [Calothrix sp. NIES-4105]
MKILYLTTVLPSKKQTGGEIASQTFIEALERDNHEVTVVGYQRQELGTVKTNEITVDARNIETHKSYFAAIVWMGNSLLKNLPYSATKYYSKKYNKIVTSLLKKYNYDTIIIDHAQIGWITNLLTRNQISKNSKIIFIAHNVEHQLYLAQYRSAKSQLSKYIYLREAHLIKAIENKLASSAHQVWTLTQSDSKYFYKFNQHSIVFDLPASKTPSNKALKHQIFAKFDIGIIGSWTWKANLLGLKWFFQSVYPCLPKHLSIHVAGLGAEWLQGEYANVEYCGFVPDVQAFMAQAKVIAIPSITGGGVQIKTLDAIASGLPIVATPVALRGIFDYPSLIKVAEQPDEFAYTLVDLLGSNLGEDTCSKLIDERLQWLKSRQEQFLTNVTGAINNLSVTFTK